MDRLSEIPDGSVDLVLADLPYGTTRNKWDSLLPLDRLWSEYWRVCKSNAAVVLCASQPFTSTLVMSQPARFRHEWVWIKNRGSNFANTVREPMKEHESVLVFSRGKWAYNKQMQARTGGGASRVAYQFNFRTETDNYNSFGGKQDASLPELRVPSSWQKFNCEVGLHPTQKPVGLMNYLIRTYSNPDETVLDNCMGSGTAGVAAKGLGRRFIGIEKDATYFEAAVQRIKSAVSGP